MALGKLGYRLSDFSNFRAVYDELTDTVARSRHQFFADNLRNWFSVLDQTPDVKEIIARIESGIDIKAFLTAANATRGSFVGSGKLNWPNDWSRRLGTQLLLFREMAEGRIEGWQFAVDFVYEGNNLNDNVRALSDQVFSPFARDLRRYLQNEIEHNSIDIIPASDRTVTINHNSEQYRHVREALENVEIVLREANDYPDIEDKEQRIIEVSAGKRLLESVRVSAEAVKAVLLRPLIYLAKKFVDAAIGIAARIAVEAVKALIGL